MKNIFFLSIALTTLISCQKAKPKYKSFEPSTVRQFMWKHNDPNVERKFNNHSLECQQEASQISSNVTASPMIPMPNGNISQVNQLNVYGKNTYNSNNLENQIMHDIQTTNVIAYNRAAANAPKKAFNNAYNTCLKTLGYFPKEIPAPKNIRAQIYDISELKFQQSENLIFKESKVNDFLHYSKVFETPILWQSLRFHAQCSGVISAKNKITNTNFSSEKSIKHTANLQKNIMEIAEIDRGFFLDVNPQFSLLEHDNFVDKTSTVLQSIFSDYYLKHNSENNKSHMEEDLNLCFSKEKL